MYAIWSTQTILNQLNPISKDVSSPSEIFSAWVWIVGMDSLKGFYENLALAK